MTTSINSMPLRTKLKSIPGFFGVRLEEAPKYYVLCRKNNKQIRKYSPFMMAQTFVRGDYDYASNEGFYRLANYIFGQNSDHQQLAMSTPVFQSRGKKLVMAAPILNQQHLDGWMMSFILPSRFRIEDLPRPLIDNITIVAVPSLIVGTIKYSGSSSENKMQLKTNELVSWLESKEDYQIQSEPRLAQYDGPHTMPLFRRNEIQITLKELKYSKHARLN